MMNSIPSAVLIAASGVGSGRLLPSVAAILGLVGVIVGARAVARSRRGNARGGACFAIASGLTSLVIGVVHAANSAGGVGTGNGLAGAFVAVALGLIGMVLGGLALARSRRPQSDSDPSR